MRIKSGRNSAENRWAARVRIGALVAVSGFAGGAMGGDEPVQLVFDDGLITEADLLAGMFDGQNFTLGELLELTIRDAAELDILGNLGDRSDDSDNIYFDFLGTNVRLESGGTLNSSLSAGTAIENINLTLADGAKTDRALGFLNSTIRVDGGILSDAVRLIGDTSLSVIGGSVGNTLDVGAGAGVEIHGGTVGAGLMVQSGGSLVMTGGEVGYNLNIFEGTTALLAGGRAGFGFLSPGGGTGIRLRPGSSLLIDGTDAVGDISFGEGSRLEMRSGSIGEFFVLDDETDYEVIVSGGAIGRRFINESPDANVVFRGNGLEIDGVPVQPGNGENSITLDFNSFEHSIVSGFFADGSPFLFLNEGFYSKDEMGEITFEFTEVQSQKPRTFVASVDQVPHSLAAGQSLIVDAGSTGPEQLIAAGGNQIDIGAGAILPAGLKARGATINIDGGALRGNATFLDGSRVYMSSGTLGADKTTLFGGDPLEFRAGSELHIASGILNNDIEMIDSKLVISGGEMHIMQSISTTNGTVDVFDGGDDINVTVTADASEVTVHSGNIRGLRLSNGSTAKIHSGRYITGFGSGFSASNSAVEIYGGEFMNFSVTGDSILSVHGGRFYRFGVSGSTTATVYGGDFTTDPALSRLGIGGSAILELIGTEFLIDGQPIIGLEPGGTFEIDQLGVTLTATLSDGSRFDWYLTSDLQIFDAFRINDDAVLRVTLVPAPATASLSLVSLIATRRRR